MPLLSSSAGSRARLRRTPRKVSDAAQHAIDSEYFNAGVAERFFGNFHRICEENLGSNKDSGINFLLRIHCIILRE